MKLSTRIRAQARLIAGCQALNKSIPGPDFARVVWLKPGLGAFGGVCVQPRLKKVVWTGRY